MTVEVDMSGLTHELRVAIRYITTDVPGQPSDRARKAADDFARSKLSRPFSFDTDFFHLTTEFDSKERKAVWILCDFNVHGPRPVAGIPTQFWQANYNGNLLPPLVFPAAHF